MTPLCFRILILKLRCNQMRNKPKSLLYESSTEIWAWWVSVPVTVCLSVFLSVFQSSTEIWAWWVSVSLSLPVCPSFFLSVFLSSCLSVSFFRWQVCCRGIIYCYITEVLLFSQSNVLTLFGRLVVILLDGFMIIILD